MENNWDFGIAEDFDNMTYELGREVWVAPRDDDLTYEGQENTNSGFEIAKREIVFLQELNTEHEMIASGQMNVGDVRFTFQSNTVAEEEGYVSPDKGITNYKILQLTKVKNMTNNKILYVKGFGKKVPGR